MVSKSVVLNGSDEKFGIPQLQHIHDRLVLARALYTPGDMSMQLAWNHLSQLSQHTALSFHLQALEHTWQGYLGALGPGFDSIPAMSKVRKSNLLFSLVEYLVFLTCPGLMTSSNFGSKVE
jgi:hypothetical protein